MVRLRWGISLGLAVAIVLFTSAVVRANDAGDNGTISATLDVLTPVTIAGTTLKPGTYTVKAEDTKVTLSRNGKAVAQASVQWKDTPDKSKSTNVLADNGTIKEIHFSGKTRYVEITN